LSFEVLNQDRGFVLYENLINKIYSDPAVLSIATLNDRGYVFVNQEFRGIFSRSQSIVTMPLSGTVHKMWGFKGQTGLNLQNNVFDFPCL
jgi:hypothetical protein